MSMPVAEKEVAQFPANREELVALVRDVYREEYNAKGKKVLSLEEIKKAFLALPGEEYRKYETTIAGYARDWADFLIKKAKDDDTEPLIRQLLPKENEPLVYGSDEEKIAFAAFAVAINYERLQKNRQEEKELLETYREFFDKKKQNDNARYEHVYFFHLDVLHRLDMVVGSTDTFKRELLRAAKANSENLTKNVGGHHAFAEAVALVYENADEQLQLQLNEAPENWREAAKESIGKVIEDDQKPNAKGEIKKYAKYYCTYGRVLALCGDYDEALKNVDLAIALEDNTRTDYSIRIGQYSSHYQQILAQKKLHLQEGIMADQLQEMKLALEAQEKESMAKNMEFLGLFSGIVSFTIGSLTITGAIAEQSIKHAAGLIVVLMGALMCVFAAFGMLLHGFHAVKKDENTQKFTRKFMFRHLVVFILGVLVLVGGILFCLN